MLIRVFEETLLREKENFLLSTLQLRKNLFGFDERTRRYGGTSFLEKYGIIVLLTIIKVMMTLKIRNPSKFDLNTCEVIEITIDEIWNPHQYREDQMN